MKTRGAAPLIVIAVIAGVGLLGAAVGAKHGGSGAKWYAPRTWFSHKPADKADHAKDEEVKAAERVDVAHEQLIHAAAVEADKTVKAAAQLPPSPAAEVVKRTAGNTAGLLNQASPISAEESQANTALILGLLSKEIEKRAAAEAKQAEAEKELAIVSKDLSAAQQAHADTARKLSEAQGQLRVAFENRNALANEFEAATARQRILAVLAVLLLLGIIYAHFCLGSVGAMLHGAEKYMDPADYHRLVGTLDGELSKGAQWVVRTGRAAAAAAEAKARAALGHSPASTPPQP